MIDKKTIEHIAKLSRLSIDDNQAAEYSQQLSKALDYFNQISKVNTEGVEPLVTPTQIDAFWREDIATKEFTTEEMTSSAPSKSGHLFKVPPVV